MDSGLHVERVFVGRPAVIGHRRGSVVMSAITKAPVSSPTIVVGSMSLLGDAQADLTVHGGTDKAIYVYPSRHYRAWRRDGFNLTPGDVGENVTVDGPSEHEITIGSTWAWGTAVLQVTQPRAPCFKLAMKTGRNDIVKHMITSGRCGWYLRVLEPGDAPTNGAMDPVHVGQHQVTVAQAFRAMFDPEDHDARTRVVNAPDLAPQWRDALRERSKSSSPIHADDRRDV